MDLIFVKWSKRSKPTIWTILAIALFACVTTGQNKCVSADRMAVLLSQIKSSKDLAPNAQLKDEILALKKDLADGNANKDRRSSKAKTANTDNRALQTDAERRDRLCQIL